eukprot:TRINITY_DN31011_c0_g1_i1.p1 TRINITY_DN31011_c0_g1~~TRINITY_DN31011_c0_g1_i1.p1  ORF type:complete len:651 (+),score=167.62 TRINITY_DN31011_c0_g1_i1:92-1954(+)
MEVRMDILNSQGNVPKDVFVALRVADSQKQSRLADSRTFHFSSAREGDERYAYGRIELFRRIGTATVPLVQSLEGDVQDTHEVRCSDPELKQLSLRVTAAGAGKAEPAQPTARGKGSDGAKKYLEEHRLEEAIAMAMRDVLKLRPDSPHKMLAERLLSIAGEDAKPAPAPAPAPPPVPKDTPPKEEAPEEPAAEESAPPAPPAPEQAAAPKVDAGVARSALQGDSFAGYYNAYVMPIVAPTDLVCLQGKFPVKAPTVAPTASPAPAPAPAPSGKADAGSARSALAAAPFTGYYSSYLLPSVSPLELRCLKNKFASSQPKQDAAPAPAKVEAKPEVPASSPAPSALSTAPFTEYYTSTIMPCAAMNMYDLPSLRGRFPAHELADMLKDTLSRLNSRAQTPAAKEEASAPADYGGFHLKPSVGTWYNKSAVIRTPPQEAASSSAVAAGDAQEALPQSGPSAGFFLKPSVGTWHSFVSPQARRAVLEPVAAEEAETADVPFAMKASVGTWCREVRPGEVEEALARDAAEREQREAEEAERNAPLVSRLPLRHIPSAGWLQQTPFQVERPWYYAAPVANGAGGAAEAERVTKLQEEIVKRDMELDNLRAEIQRLKEQMMAGGSS